MTSHRMFSVDEAEALIPRLSADFERIVRLREQVTQHYRRLKDAGVDIDLHGDILALDLEDIDAAQRPDAARLKQMVQEIARTVAGLHEDGCLVKDLRVGLVDFYSVVDGEMVFLCWQYGEPKITHYHPIDEGFAGRRPLTGKKQSGIVYN